MTPVSAVKAILPHLKLWPGYTVVDPNCGEGNVFKAIHEYARKNSLGADIDDLKLIGITKSSKTGARAAKEFEHFGRIASGWISFRDALGEGAWTKPKANLAIFRTPVKGKLEYLKRAANEVCKDAEIAMLAPLLHLTSFCSNYYSEGVLMRGKPDVYAITRGSPMLHGLPSPIQAWAWFVWSRDRTGKYEVLQ
jgi:hypothetical protein